MNSIPPITRPAADRLPASSPRALPIQGLWIGELKLLERLSIASFLANGHPYHLYVYEEPADIPKGVDLHDANTIIPREHIFTYPYGKAKGGLGGFANLFRYRLLSEKGGWWCDTDVIALRPFKFSTELVLASERHWLFPNKICNNVILCPANHPLMTASYEAAMTMDPHVLAHAANGAPLLRRHVKRLKLQHFIQPPEVFNPVNWYQSDSIATSVAQNSITPSTCAVHCYRDVWRWRLTKNQIAGFRDRVFTPDSLLGQLQIRYLGDSLSLDQAADSNIKS